MRSVPSLRATKPTCILLVDDNVHGLVARRTILEALGYTVISASCGFDALEISEQQSFDLIVTDFRMPGMDGVALIRALRGRDYQGPIILLSGFLTHLGLNEQNTGANLLIQKCSNESELLVRGVRRLLSAPRKPAAKQQSAKKQSSGAK